MFAAKNTQLLLQYINTKNNKAADRLSRVPLGSTYTINPCIVQAAAALFVSVDVDRFATSLNTVCTTFNSYFFKPGCAGIDAFAQSNWEND